jgi:adenosylcobinamide kinase / adenosylcobinamide-phosphate guanylyltransferase
MTADGSIPLVLVLGGARSGKSRFALDRGAALGPPWLFVATAEERDAEMAARIARHREDRASEWRTIEEPTRLDAVLRDAESGVVLIDCLTLWLANVMESADPDVGGALDELLAALAGRRASVVAVSNEVGLGIVPEHCVAREFRDLAGTLNRRIAELATEMHLLVAGQPLRVK